MGEVRYLSAREAAGELGVSLPTLYAYVSRGLIRSESAGKSKRARRYRAEDVRRLRERAERRRDPDRASEGVLSWGGPVMESAITLISEGKLYYRGRDAVRLAREGTVEEVAALVWTGDTTAAASGLFAGPAVLSPRLREARRGVADLAPLDAFGVLLPLAAAEDPAAYDLRSAAVARAGARILRDLVAISAGDDGEGGVAETLARGWAPEEPDAAALIGAALILCADHELNVSAFTARCVASSGATPYAAVSAALAALGGTRHGGQTELVEALLREVGGGGDARRVFAARLRRGEGIPGFGHSLYPEGDPRGRELLRLAAGARPRSPEVALSRAVCEAARGLIEELPTVDLGLVTLARVLGLPPGAPLALFALGRTIGWIGHSIEQYEDGSLIRPRARYTGEPPRDSEA